MKERGNRLNLPGKHNAVWWNLGPRKSLTITPHVDIHLSRRWQLRIEGSYCFFIHRRFTDEEWEKNLVDLRAAFREEAEEVGEQVERA